jgi:hypothetical protein
VTITYTLQSREGTTSNPLRFSHARICQWSPGAQKRDCQQRQGNEATIPSVLCFGGPHRVQKILFRNGKDLLRRCYECPQALTLF